MLIRAGVLAVVLGAIALLVRVKLRAELEPKAALAILQKVQSEPWAVPAFAGVYLALTTALAPAMVLHMVAGAAWGFGRGLATNLIVFNLAAHAHFFLARRLGRERVTALLGNVGTRLGLSGAIAVRVLPLPTLVASASAGVSGMRWRDFAIGTALGALPWIAIYTWFAAALVAGAEGAERTAFLQAFVAALVILAGTALVRRSQRPRSSALKP